MRRLTLLLSLLLSLPSLAQNLSPGPNQQTNQSRPTISATFDRDVGRARIWIDGTEFTNSADHRGRTVSLVPPYNLDYGTHRVQVRTGYGATADWNFQIVNRPSGSWNNNGNNNGNWNNNGNNGNWNNNGNNGNNGNWNNGNQGWNQGAVTEVLQYGPTPGSVVTVTRPPISAVFNGDVRNLRMTVDGVDVTGSARVRGGRINWTPNYDLDQGQHNCIVTATARNGQAVRGDWNFTIRSW